VIKFQTGQKCLATASPVFDSDNNLKIIIELVRNIDELAELAKKIDTSGHSKLDDVQQKIVNITTDYRATKNTLLNPKMIQIYKDARKIANFDSTILLTGETGVGKDYLATYIHKMSEWDSKGELVKVNCSVIPEHLIESELFGYEDGSFTGAKKGGKKGLFDYANNGTLFLDEIGEMPYILQVKLLNVLNDKCFYRVGSTHPIKFTGRIIAATNADLVQLVAEKKFRMDLFYRLNVISFEIPPLRERSEEILPIAKKLLKHFYNKYNKTCFFSTEVLEVFLRYPWPGNIREMKNVIERLVLITETERIDFDLLPQEFLYLKKPSLTAEKQETYINYDLPLSNALDKFEAQFIRTAIERNGSLKKTSEKLGIGLSTLVRKKRKFDI
jgi:transcriptional regulator with PAS, ATPase and Fis domain